MIRRYCDCCGDEMFENIGINHRLQAIVSSKDGKFNMCVEVITSKNGVSNDGDFCKYCIIDAINEIDDR